MKYQKFLCALPLAFILFSLNYVKENENKKDLDTNIIVSLKEYKNLSKEEVSDIFYQELISNIGFNYRNIDEFNVLGNYLSLKVNSEDIELINSLSTVNYAYEEVEYALSEYDIYEFSPIDPTYDYRGENQVLETNYSLNEMNFDSSTMKRGDNTFIAILDSAFNLEHESFNTSLDNEYADISKSDIDSIIKNNSDFNGKDYTYSNNKVVFSYDYALNDNDVLARSEHGSHVASIASSSGRYKGIASSSQLALMKVFNDREGGCTSSVYLKALEDCYLLGVDSINMSFGSALNYETYEADKAVNEVISALVDEGCNVFVAAGNDGKSSYIGTDYEYSSINSVDTGLMSDLSNHEDVITVGSSTLSDDVSNVYGLIGNRSIAIYDRIKNYVGYEDGEGYIATYYPEEVLFYDYTDENKEFEYVVIPGYGAKNDYGNLDVNGKIAVVDRGEIPFYLKIQRAIEAGASGLIIVNSEGESSLPYFAYEISDDEFRKNPDLKYKIENGEKVFDLSYIDIPVAVVTYNNGETLKNSEEKTISFYNESLSTFSSSGPGSDLTLKVDLVAPGSSVYGAIIYDSVKGDYSDSIYGFKNGTSMATPNLTGAYTSLLSSFEYDETNEKEVKESVKRKMLSATTLLKDEHGEYLSPRRQGNGLVNLKNAFNTISYLTQNGESNVELYSLKDKDNIEYKATLTSEKASKYDAQLVIMAPKIYKDDITGKSGLFINEDDLVLETVDLGQINAIEGENEVIVDHVLTSSSKDYLANFPNGIYLEGYLILNDLENEEISLNMPFLSFYGDYSEVSPYEEFSFLKDSELVYESEIVDNYAKNTYGRDNFRSGSYFLLGKDDNYYYTNIVDGSSSLEKEYLILDGYKDEEGIIHVYSEKDYLSSSNNYEGLSIQLFITKSVVNNNVTLFDENNSLISSYRFEDTYYNNQTSAQLYRSTILPQSSLESSYHFVHRGFLFIPLEDLTIDETSAIYTLNLTFNLVDGSIYNELIKLHLNEEYISYPKIMNMTLSGDTLKIFVSDISLKEITLNSISIKDNNEYLEVNGTSEEIIITLNLDSVSYSTQNTIFIEITSNEDAKIGIKYFKVYGFILGGRDVNNGINLGKTTLSPSSYNIKVKSSNGSEVNFVNDVYYSLMIDFDNFKELRINDNGSLSIVNINNSDNEDFIRFKSKYSSFNVYLIGSGERIYNGLIYALYGLLGVAGILLIGAIVIVVIKKNSKNNR